MSGTAHVDRFVLERLPAPDAMPDFLFDLPELRYPDRLNAAVALIDRADTQAIAVMNDAGRWTYGEMAALSDRIAGLLVTREGLVPGNRVLLRGANGAMLLAAWLGVLKAGGVVVATMPLLRAGEIATLIDRAQISHAIIDARVRDDFDVVARDSQTLRSVLAYNGDAGGGDLEALLAEASPIACAVDTHRDDPALIAFTSGTTGDPKGCIHYHRDILACADSFARHILAPEPADRFLCSAPIAFTFGLGMQAIFPWRFGAAAVTLEAPTPANLLDAARRFGATMLATAPTAYRAMLGLLDDAPLPHLRTCVSAGEHLPLATWQAWHEATGLRIIDGIGATEMMHIFVSASGDAIRPGTTGLAVPGYRAAILDEGLDEIAEGIGRLAVKGPTGCRYLADPRQGAYVQGGWNLTGDTFRRHADGYFTFVARSDDMIVSSGYNIAAPEVEAALAGHPAVAECAVIGVPCAERGQRVKAFVVTAPGHAAGAALAEALQAHVKASIAPYKYPREIAFVENLPRTATGKLQRHALRAKRDGAALE